MEEQLSSLHPSKIHDSSGELPGVCECVCPEGQSERGHSADGQLHSDCSEWSCKGGYVLRPVYTL